MNKFCGVLLAVLCCASAALAQADASLSGRVADAQNAAVAGAAVRLVAREQSVSLTTQTDQAGAYRFARLAPGLYLLEAAAPGFARAAQEVRVERGQTATRDFALQPAGVRAEVVITASGTAQTVDELSKALTTVTQAEIEERDEFSVAEALRNVPGVRVRQLGTPGALTTIRLRGLRNQDTAVLLDGLRFRDTAAPQGDAAGLIGNLVVTDLSRIEVLRGSGSSLYGTNAIGGVINLVTDEGGGPLHGKALVEGGSLGFVRAQVQAAASVGSGDRFVYSLGLSHFNFADGVDGDDQSRNTSGQGRVLLRLAPALNVSARVYASDAFLKLNESPDIIGTLPATGIVNAVALANSELRRFETGTPRAQLHLGAANFILSANDPDATQATNFFAGALNLGGRLSEAFGYSLTYQGFTSDRTNYDGPRGVSPFEPLARTRSDNDGRVHTLSARGDWQAGRFNLFTFGYEFERESFVSRAIPAAPATATRVDVTQRSNALFIQEQLRLLADRLQISGAFRAQFFALQQPDFAPPNNAPYRGSFAAPPNAYTGDGSIAYFIRASGTKLRAHVGNGYRAPSLYERFGTFYSSFSGSFSTLGDPRLRPDRSLAFDAGVDQTLINNRLRASASYFYTRLQEVVGFGRPVQPDPFGRSFSGYINTGGGLARGVELSVQAAAHRSLNFTAAYTFTNSDERVPRDGVLTALAIPKHQFSFVATQHLGRLLINFDLIAASDYLAPLFRSVAPFDARTYRFDGLVKGDLGASYTVPLDDKRSLRFFGKADNVFNRRYFEDGFRTPGRVGVGGVAVSF